jgi:threonine dehydrogenase-like Zn-dependent dehydrogenase
MASNRAVIFMGPMKMEIQDKGYPKLEDPKGRKIEHAVILKLVTTNICGSDLHIYHGRFAAPSGMVMGHENTGEVVEIGSHVESIKKGDLCSVPFNVACGTCRSCRERHTDVCLRANEELARGGCIALVPDLRSRRLLRLLSASARKAAFPSQRASNHPILRTGRGLALVLYRPSRGLR